MKKVLVLLVVVAVLVTALGVAGLAYAQSPSGSTGLPGSGVGPGMRGGRGPRGGMGGSVSATGEGILHEAMLAVFSEKLGFSVADLEARLANGETMAQIALSTGLTFDEFRTLMVEARSQAIDQAVADGTLTQAQADWMKTRGGGQMGGAGAMRGGGMGQGLYANPNCPYATSTTP